MTKLEPATSFRPEEFRDYLGLIVGAHTLRNVAGKFDASDIVQESLLRAHQRAEQFAGSTENEYRGWLRRILENVVCEVARRFSTQARATRLEQSINASIEESGRKLDQLILGATESPSTRVSTQELLDRMLAAIEKLPVDQREAVRLHHLLQMSVDDVATTMNKSPASVAGLIRRGVKELRSTMANTATSQL